MQVGQRRIHPTIAKPFKILIVSVLKFKLNLQLFGNLAENVPDLILGWPNFKVCAGLKNGNVP